MINLVVWKLQLLAEEHGYELLILPAKSAVRMGPHYYDYSITNFEEGMVYALAALSKLPVEKKVSAGC